MVWPGPAWPDRELEPASPDFGRSGAPISSSTVRAVTGAELGGKRALSAKVLRTLKGAGNSASRTGQR